MLTELGGERRGELDTVGVMASHQKLKVYYDM